MLVVAAYQDEQNIISLGYIGFTLYYLINPFLLFDSGNKVMFWFRLYNLFVILILIIYQVREQPRTDALPARDLARIVTTCLRMPTVTHCGSYRNACRRAVCQIPELSGPLSCEAYSNCFTWETLIGFVKYRPVVVAGYPRCYTALDGSSVKSASDNSNCAPPFSASSGLGVCIVVFALTMFQAHMYGPV